MCAIYVSDLMDSSLAYLLSVLLAIAGYAIAGLILWQGVELVYRIYCKIKGIKY
jgi:hypothetical protein